jgi:hypothetical protein
LSIVATEKEIGYFLRKKMRCVNEWRPPFWKYFLEKHLYLMNKGNKYMAMNLADCLEAVIGAIFATNYLFEDVIKFF